MIVGLGRRGKATVSSGLKCFPLVCSDSRVMGDYRQFGVKLKRGFYPVMADGVFPKRPCWKCSSGYLVVYADCKSAIQQITNVRYVHGWPFSLATKFGDKVTPTKQWEILPGWTPTLVGVADFVDELGVNA